MTLYEIFSEKTSASSRWMHTTLLISDQSRLFQHDKKIILHLNAAGYIREECCQLWPSRVGAPSVHYFVDWSKIGLFPICYLARCELLNWCFPSNTSNMLPSLMLAFQTCRSSSKRPPTSRLRCARWATTTASGSERRRRRLTCSFWKLLLCFLA